MKKEYKKKLWGLLIIVVVAFIAFLGSGSGYIGDFFNEVKDRITESSTEVKKPEQQTDSEKRLVGKVIKVADGDTMTLMDNNGTKRKVRLNGIDCPEIGQDYGDKAKQYVEKLAINKYVNVDIIGIDKYDRILGVVYIDDVNINEALLENGFAWVYKYNKDERYNYLAEQAKAKKLNLWSNSRAINPHEWRKQHNR